MPGGLLDRFNTDPLLIVALLLAAAVHLLWCRRHDHPAGLASAGWAVAAAALVSPLCALSVSLFSARVGQHMILLLIAAPLIAVTLPRPGGRAGLWGGAAAFFLALWFWHMPVPYAATFGSAVVYWAMHVTLFASAIWLWRALLGHDAAESLGVLAAGLLTSMQMSLLGAVLTLSGHALFAPHYLTTQAWGLTPLADQQLGGVLMWVPGCLLFLWAAMRSMALLWRSLDGARAA